MSEKYSTDELVRALEIQLKMETDCVITNLEIRAIIARLRAADALCKAARLAVFEIPAPTPDSLMTFKIDGSMDDLRKAIAEYERKE